MQSAQLCLRHDPAIGEGSRFPPLLRLFCLKDTDQNVVMLSVNTTRATHVYGKRG